MYIKLNKEMVMDYINNCEDYLEEFNKEEIRIIKNLIEDIKLNKKMNICVNEYFIEFFNGWENFGWSELEYNIIVRFYDEIKIWVESIEICNEEK